MKINLNQEDKILTQMQNPRFTKIELSQTEASNMFNLDISKVGADLNDHINAFQAILIQKHEIDKIKSDERVAASAVSISNASKKIFRGMKLVEYMLQERYWFIKVQKFIIYIKQEMRVEDEGLLQVVSELHEMTDIQTIQDFNQPDVESKINAMKLKIKNFQINFQRANNSLLALDKRFLHQMNWKNELIKDSPKDEGGNMDTLLQANLMESSNRLYSFFKRKQITLQQIHSETSEQSSPLTGNENQGSDSIKEKELNDEQIQNLVFFLTTFSDELSEVIPIQIKILCHLWIDDLIKVQAQYSKNLTLYSSFLTSFTGQFDEIIFFIRKTNQNINLLKSDNENVLRLLRMIQLPQQQANYNINYHLNAQQKISKSQQDLLRIKKELVEFYKQERVGIFLQISNDQGNEDEKEERPVGEFPGAIKLISYEKNILDTLVLNEVSKLSKQIVNNNKDQFLIKKEDLEIQTDAVTRIVNKVKDMWICEKKLRKAQNHYIKAADTLQKATQAINIQHQDYEDLNNQDLVDLFQLGMDLWTCQQSLQKLTNALSYYSQIVRELQQILPLVGDFVVVVEKFMIKANLLQEQGIAAALNEYKNQIVKQSITQIKRSQGLFKKPPPKVIPPPPPEIDSDEDFQKNLNKQGFLLRNNNEQVEDVLLIAKPKKKIPSNLTQTQNGQGQMNPSMISLTDDLISNNKGNQKIENIYSQKTFDNPYFDKIV